VIVIIWNIVITNILKLLDFGIILGTTWIIILITIYPHDDDIIYGKISWICARDKPTNIYSKRTPVDFFLLVLSREWMGMIHNH